MIQRFSNYLSESLDTPIEFTLTDDTDLPNRIYGVFTIDATQYGMSLELTTFDHVYELRMYKINDKKPRLWMFTSPSHIRKCLSTLIKFAELCVPLVKNTMHGIIVKIPGSSPAAKFNTFVQLMIKKTYIKSFTNISVFNNAEDDKKSPYEFLFLIRKGVTPSAVFGSKMFKKYNITGNTIPAESLEDLKQKMPQKTTLETTPSKTYAVKDLSIKNIEIDHSVFDKIVAAKHELTLTGKISVVEELKKQVSEKDFSTVENILNKLFSYDNAYVAVYYRLEKDSFEREKWKAAVGIEKMSLLKKYNFTSDEAYYVTANIIKAYDVLTDDDLIINIYENLRKQNLNFGILDNYRMEYETKIRDLYKLDLTFKELETKFKSEFTKLIKTLMSIDKKLLNIIISNFAYFIVAYQKTHKYPSTEFDKPLQYEEYKATTLDPSVHLENGLSDKSGKIDYNNTPNNIKELKEDLNRKINIIEKEWGFKEKFKALPEITRTSLRSYTGSSYGSYNNLLRRKFTAYTKAEQYNPSHEDKTYSIDVEDASKGFDLIDPVPKGFWTYRTTGVNEEIIEDLKKGDHYIDPAFLSTSINSTLSFGYDNVKFRIYVPAGSRVIPILSNSKNANENEVILPPFSILKILKIFKYNLSYSQQYFVECAFIGTAKDSFNEAFNKKFSMVKENTDNKKTVKTLKTTSSLVPVKYNPNEKYGTSVDPETLKLLNTMLKDKKLTF